MKVHEAVAAAAVVQGGTVWFGLMGDANLLYISDFKLKHGGRFIDSIDDRNSVAMADGFSKATGGISVATVTHGPALSHTATAMIEAARARSPMVILTGQTPSVHNHIQHLDVRSVASMTGVGYERVYSPGSVFADVARAFRLALVERRPYLLDVPCDLLAEEAGDENGSCKPPHVFQRTRPDAEVIDEALGVLLAAKAPVLIAGRGAVESDAREALVELAELIGSPLATSLLGKDYFTGQRLNLGVCGTVANSVAISRIRRADVVVAFGASLNHFTADEGQLLGHQRVVQVDRDPTRIGSFTPVEVAVIGDARSVAEAMIERLRELGHAAPARHDVTLEQGLADWLPTTEFRDRSTPDAVDLQTAMVELDRVLPKARNLVSDVGRYMTTPWRYLHVDDPKGFVHAANFASIGLGLPTALGVAIARPDRPTVLVVGDGGFMQSAVELWTAARLNLPLIVVVANDGAYGAEWRALTAHGVEPRLALRPWPDLVTLAQSLGADGICVKSVEEIDKLSGRFGDLDGPILIDVRIDPAVEVAW